jgi:hypothetical protein
MVKNQLDAVKSNYMEDDCGRLELAKALMFDEPLCLPLELTRVYKYGQQTA